MKCLLRCITVVTSFIKCWGLDPNGIVLSTSYHTLIDNLKELIGLERTMFIERLSDLSQNLVNLLKYFWGWRDPKLRVYDMDVAEHSENFGARVLLENVKLAASGGVDRGCHENFQSWRILLYLFSCGKQDNDNA